METFSPSPNTPSVKLPRLTRRVAQLMTILQLADYTVFTTYGGGMLNESLKRAHMATKELATRFGVSEMSAFFLCWFINNFDDRHLTVSDLARQLRCTNVRILTYWNEIEELRNRHYLRIGAYNGETFFQLPESVMDSVRRNRVYQAPSYSNLSEDMFLNQLQRLSFQLSRKLLSGDFFMEEIQTLIDANPNLGCSKWLQGTPPTPDVRGLMAVTIAHHLNGDRCMMMSDVEILFNDEDERMDCQRLLLANVHQMQLTGWIEQVCEDGQAVSSQWCLTTRACNEILGGATVARQADNRGLKQPESIVPKNLYFRPEMRTQLDKLQNLLSQERFPEVQRRLADSGMRSGVTCIFYGAPGTGKTESVLQLAHATGRAIMQVDISQMRDKYVGESEKRIKGIFERYRNLCHTNTVAPILLFNEADALFTRRSENAVNSTDKMENAMQNIILEEMEQLEGILIATTNLAQSMDSAFERRFLYKLEFQKPTPEESRHIWSSMVKDLSEEDAYTLAREFRFSGGQIENIARKKIISSLLDNESVALEGIRDFCKKEQMKNDSRQPVGFG